MAYPSKGAVAGTVGAVLIAVASLYPSPKGLEVLKVHEGLRTTAYYDSVQVLTICWGSTSRVYRGQVATMQECNARLLYDATAAQRGVARHVKHALTQGQNDALVSFVFNLGEARLASSTLLRKINAGDCYGAAREFDRWIYGTVRGKLVVQPGLVTRRSAERGQFEAGCYLW